VVCNNAQIVEGILQGQPTEGALLACAMKVRHLSFEESVKLSDTLFCCNLAGFLSVVYSLTVMVVDEIQVMLFTCLMSIHLLSWL